MPRKLILEQAAKADAQCIQRLADGIFVQATGFLKPGAGGEIPASPSPSRSTARPPGLRRGAPPPPGPLSAETPPPLPGDPWPGLSALPRAAPGTSSSGPQLGQESGRGLCLLAGPLPPGRTSPGRREARARATRPTMPGARANGRSGPPPAGRNPGPGCLSRRFRFVFPTVGLPGRRDALRAAGSQGPWQRPPGSAPSQAPRDPRGGRADPGGGWGTAEARAAGEGSGEKSRGAGGAQWVRSIARSQWNFWRERVGICPQVTTVAWKTRGEQGEVASDNKLEVGGKLWLPPRRAIGDPQLLQGARSPPWAAVPGPR